MRTTINNEVDDINLDIYFGENGIIQHKLRNFEVRKEQYNMAKCIKKALIENKKALIEAGTGTGKTIAYLLPLMLYALQNDLKVIVSTNTINLQEQLITKDIPLLNKIINKNFNYEIVKGKGNYLCKRKMYNLNLNVNNKDSEEEKNEKILLQKYMKWDEITETGDKTELKEEIPYKIWEKINCESDLCNGSKCPYYNDCYFFKARKNINNSNLLIVNHHMFFSDLLIRNELGFITNYSILPNYDTVIFDEAHNIEDTARNYFTYEISRFLFAKLIGNIYNKRSNINTNSLALSRLMKYLNEVISEENYVIVDEYKEKFIYALNKYYENGMEILEDILKCYSKDLFNNDIKFRIDTPEFKNNKIWKNIKLKFENLKNDFKDLLNSTNKLINFINKLNLEDENAIIFDFIKYFDRVKECYKQFSFIMEGNNSNYVYWININLNKLTVKLYATPFDISEQLNENLFTKMEKIIFTSATLSVDNKFDYFIKNLGLDISIDSKQIIQKIIKSPFNYEKQMKVHIPIDALDPNDINYLDDMEDYIVETIKYTKGKCFLLFTSYSSMNYLYNKIKKYFSTDEYTFIKQNDYSRTEMIELFKNSKNPVLFGTDSFWEGVDVQGDQLKSVIIIKLPFKVPNDPVTEAIIDNMKKKGKNSFNDYQLPYAIIKFKQGIGRLIRSKSDTGLITILDSRIITKNYGKKFISLLPKGIIKDNKKNIIKKMNND